MRRGVLDDQIERLVLDLAGVTFLDCAGVRALGIATCFAPGGCQSSSARSAVQRAGSSRCWALMTSRTSAGSPRARDPGAGYGMGWPVSRNLSR
jgi:hypothetical protein